jgi:hypothetical protein
LRRLPGFDGAYLLRRDLGGDGTVELTAHTFWQSPDAIRAFAGEDVTAAVVEPEAQAMLLDFDRTVTPSQRGGRCPGLTQFQLIGLYRRGVGITPHAYLTQIRLEPARAGQRRSPRRRFRSAFTTRRL